MMLKFPNQEGSFIESVRSVSAFSPMASSVPGEFLSEDPLLPKKSPVASVNRDKQLRRSRQRRTWSLELSKKLSSMTREYCESRSKIVDFLGVEDFTEIAQEIDRSPEQCLIRMREMHISGSTTAGIWSKAEDELLTSGVCEQMTWRKVAEYVNAVLHSGLLVRTAKHCKERWNNHLDPNIAKGKWTYLEDLTLINAYILIGDKWSLLAKQVRTRNENAVKNRIHSLLQKEKKRYGVCDKREAIDRIFKRLTEAKVVA